MIYGYARISTKHQSIERQIRNIKSAYPEAYIIQEACTGTKIDRPNFSKLLCRLAYGDIVVFEIFDVAETAHYYLGKKE